MSRDTSGEAMAEEQAGWVIEAGDPMSGVILHVPHASREIPAAERGRILLDDADLEAELDAITDADTDRLARAAGEQAQSRPWTFSNRYSRLLIDPERFPDEREEMLKVGMGAVYLRTTDQRELRSPDPADDERLMARYFHPYAQALEQLVEERLETVGRVLIIDVHSFPLKPLRHELHADQARPSLCIGTNPHHTPDALVDLIRLAWTGSVELDQPFSGCYVPERFYETDDRVQAVMLEIRRDVIEAWVGGNPPADEGSPIVAATAAVIDAVP